MYKFRRLTFSQAGVKALLHKSKHRSNNQKVVFGSEHQEPGVKRNQEQLLEKNLRRIKPPAAMDGKQECVMNTGECLGGNSHVHMHAAFFSLITPTHMHMPALVFIPALIQYI